MFGPTPRSYDAVRAAPGPRAREEERAERAGPRGRDLRHRRVRLRRAEDRRAARRSSARLGVADKKVLILTDGVKPNVFLSGRNLPNVHVMPYADVLDVPHPVVGRRARRGGRDRPDARADAGDEPRRCRSAERADAAERPAKARHAAKAAAKAPRRRRPPAKKAAKAAAKSAAKKPSAKKATAKKTAAKKSTKKKGEVSDADASSHDRAAARHREELGRVPGSRGVPLRGASRRQQAGDPPGHPDAVRRQGDRSVDVEPPRQDEARWGRASGASRTGRKRS